MTTVPAPWWTEVEGPDLAQGDYLPGCFVPIFGPEFGATGETADVPVVEYDCVVVTQSCDLENDKAPLVALCPICSLTDFEQVNPSFKRKGHWERVRKGRIEELHLLASPVDPGNNQACLVADFRAIYGLPVVYLKNHAQGLGPRWQLSPPFLEHFSQAFARFFMRVGLPSSIPAFG